MSKIDIKNNNLDLLRLMFSVQVMLYHVAHYVLDEKWTFLNYFPGVPAFFFVSGFLIYASCLNSGSLANYAKNRFLRLFPGLCFVTLGAWVVVGYAKGANFILENFGFLSFWSFLQVSIGQAYNPGAFRDVGVGVINGSLWTITVEILFYFLVPLLVYLSGRMKIVIESFSLASFSVYLLSYEGFFSVPLFGKELTEYLQLTPIYWGWMFGLGMLAYKYINYIPLDRKWFILSILGCVFFVFFDLGGVYFNSSSNYLGAIYFVFYSYIILYCAFSFKKIPLGVDLSYGIYIWHMPIVNFALLVAFDNRWLMFWSVILMSVMMAVVSWNFVELKSLRLKKRTLHAR